jgi:PhzF family phenazine biosynthesis protein
MPVATLHKYAAFTTTPQGGNPAGVWVGDALPSPAEMQRIAAEVGYSETAFVAPASGFIRTVRYYSPLAEVPFCGHATIASGVHLGASHGDGNYSFETLVGTVKVDVQRSGAHREASLTSVATKHTSLRHDLLERALDALHWHEQELDLSIPPALAFAGGWHLVLAVSKHDRLARLNYDFEMLKAMMLEHDLTTLQLIWRESENVFHARDPFPVGGVVEDPATGAAAAALGGYLRDANLITVPAHITIHQGETMGRPSLIDVRIPETGGIIVSGAAVPVE